MLDEQPLYYGLDRAVVSGGLTGGVFSGAGYGVSTVRAAPRRSLSPATRLLESARARGKVVGPTIDQRTGWEVGRFLVDEHGNVMIEPVGGYTKGGGPGFVQTRYPNGSYYQRLDPGHPEPGITWPHGHGYLLGTGPGRKGAGPSLDMLGNSTDPRGFDAHWRVRW